MLTVFGSEPSRNAWKVRQLLQQLNHPYRTISIDVLEGEGQHPSHLRINPAGKIPAAQLGDGRTLSESDAIVCYLADGSSYLPRDPFVRANVLQWISFEQEQIGSTIGTLGYWNGLGTSSNHSPVEAQCKCDKAGRAFGILDNELATHNFLVADRYTVADLALLAYTTCAPDVGVSMSPYQQVLAWIERVQAQLDFLIQTAIVREAASC